MDDMVKDHRTDVAEFKKESTSGQDAEVKAFATKTLPTLEEHLSLAEQMAAKK
jgi:putative membrane protein